MGRNKIQTVFDYMNIGKMLITRPIEVKRGPEHIILDPSDICNFKCKVCKNRHLQAEKAILEYNDFKKIYDQVRPRRITFVGYGEPFINPRMLDMVRYSRTSSDWVSLTSNFSLVSDIIPDIVKSGLSVLKISLDGATKKTYESMRCPGNFDKIVDDIKSLQKAKVSLGIGSPTVRLNYVINPENVSEIMDFVELTKSFGVGTIVFYLERGNIKQIIETLSNKDRDRIRKASIHAQTYGIGTNLDHIISEIDNFDRYSENPEGDVLQKNPKRFFKCPYPWFTSMIEVDGRVIPCCHYDTSGQDSYYGNVLEDGWDNIWNGTKYKNLRRMMREGKNLDLRCKFCNGLTVKQILSINRILPGFN